VPGHAPGKTAVQFNGSATHRDWAFGVLNTGSRFFSGLPPAFHPPAEIQTSLYHPFTVSFWCKVSARPAAHQVVFSDGVGLICYVGPGASSSSNTFRVAFSSADWSTTLADENVPLNTWHQVTVVYDGVSARLYTDGGQKAHLVFAQFPGFIAGGTLVFGGGFGMDNYIGCLGGVTIWGRPFRAEEVVRLHTEQAAGAEPLVTPVAPSDLFGTSPPQGSVTLTWQDNSRNETGFTIERSPNGTSFAPIGSVGPDLATYVDTLAPTGGTNYYRVKAFNSFGDSAYSNVRTIGGDRPLPPSGLRVSNGR
jgi:hypothetical protein